MVAWRYEISFLVLKNISCLCCARSWNIFSTLAEKFPISAQPSNILYHYPMESSTHSLNNWGLVPIILFAGQGIVWVVSDTVSLSNHGLCWKGTGCLYYYRVIKLAKLTVRKTIRCLQVPLHQDVAAQFLEKIYSHEPGENFTTHTFVGLIFSHFENLQDNFFCVQERD